MYKVTAYFWLSLIANFLLQALAQNSQTVIVLSFSFSLIPVNLLCITLYSILQMRYPYRFILALSGASIVASLIFLLNSQSFLLAALPLSVAAAYPLFLTSYVLIQSRRSLGVFMLIAFVLVCFALHGFNFALFRMDPVNQLWGWPVAYAIYQALSALLPVATLSEFRSRESQRLEEIIASKTSQLDEALRFKNFLFKTLAHDISSPLLVSQVYVNNIRNDKSHEAIDKNLSRLGKSIDKMVQITNDLKQLDLKSFNTSFHCLFECCLSCFESFESFLKLKRISLDFDEESLVNLEVQVHKTSFINSVLSNLLRNSIKFSREGSEVSVRAFASSGNRVCIEFSNYSGLIPQNILANIFEFSSEKSQIGTVGELGSGWGLPICKTLVSAYGGSIAITNEPVKNKNAPYQTTVQIILIGRVKPSANFPRTTVVAAS